jgi:predicted deacylase
MSDWTRTRIQLPGDAGFDRWRLDSEAAGPRVVIFGGTHGDETEGVIAANRLAGMTLGLAAGAVEVVPVVHEAAFAADTRTSPKDGGDLARSFPGSANGSPTEQLAHALHTKVLAGCDLLIDLHTAGRSMVIPFLAGYIDDGRDTRGLGRRAAEAFGADFVWRHPERPPGRTLSALDAAIYTEAPTPGPLDMSLVERYTAGCLRVLDALAMLARPLAPPPAAPSIRIVSGGNVDSDMQCVRSGGLFIAKVGGGDKVVRGQVLGLVTDLRGTVLEEVRAPSDGWVVVLLRRPHVRPGDRAVAVAPADTRT